MNQWFPDLISNALIKKEAGTKEQQAYLVFVPESGGHKISWEFGA